MCATLAAYYPAWYGTPVWDDHAHLTKESLRSLDGLRGIWFDIGATQQYYPVVHSLFWVFHRFWGDHTLGYHLVNIVLHASVAGLVAVTLRRLSVPGAMLTAFLFALHPVHVESVAWISELKNTASAFFYLLAALMLIEFDRTRTRAPYVAALALFVLALLSKSVTATLPAAMLVVWWWQRGTLRWREDVQPLLPFFIVGAATGLFTAWVERAHIGAQGAAFDFSLIERVLIAGRAIWFYLASLIWPANLTFVYPRWNIDAGVWWQYVFVAAAIALVVLAWTWRRRSRSPLAGLLFFIGTLFPALGFFNVYPFVFSFVADHFQYLASLGVLALAGAALTLAARRAAWVRYASAAIVIVCAVLTWRQAGDYADAATLYRATIARNPDAWMAHVNLGFERLRTVPDNVDDWRAYTPDLEQAAAHFRDALRIKPDIAEAHNNLGTTLMRLGRNDEAHAAYQQALAFRPDAPDTRVNLAVLLERMGRLEDALPHAREAIRLNPDNTSAHMTLGDILLGLGRSDEAATAYRVVLERDASHALAYLNLGTALGRQGRAEEAATAFEHALRLNPSSIEARRNLGIAMLRAGRIDEGIAVFREAARLTPSPAALVDLGHAYESVGRYDEAIAALREALRVAPDWPDARASLDRIMRSRGR